MNECSQIPLFEADQVLTAEQLNQLRRYLGQQTLLTRSRLIGVGIVCGLEVEQRVILSQQVLEVHPGVGLSSSGQLMDLPGCVLAKKRVYHAPDDYAPLETSPDWQPWELLPAEAETTPEISALESVDLAGAIVVLFQEQERLDNDSCAGASCDQLGVTERHCLRVLLVSNAHAKQLLGAGQSFPSGYTRPGVTLAHEALPALRWPRPVGLWGRAAELTWAALSDSYRRVLSKPLLSELAATLRDAYVAFKPFLQAYYPTNPFLNLSLIAGFNRQLQPYYAHIKNVVLAYNEWRDAAGRLKLICQSDESAFPQHLLLGPPLVASELDVAPTKDQLRHGFMASPLLRGQEEAKQLFQFLFRRLVLLTQHFYLGGEAGDWALRITPSGCPSESLGKQSIPYYYLPEQKYRLLQYWDWERVRSNTLEWVDAYFLNTKAPTSNAFSFLPTNAAAVKELSRVRGVKSILKSGGVKVLAGGPSLSDDSNQLKLAAGVKGLGGRISGLSPYSVARGGRLVARGGRLEESLDNVSFFKLEGHLGKNYPATLAELTHEVLQYQLPFKIIGKKLSGDATDTELPAACLSRDIELLYSTQRSERLCRLQRLADFVAGIEWPAPEVAHTESEEVGVVGTLRSLKGAAVKGLQLLLQGPLVKSKKAKAWGGNSALTRLGEREPLETISLADGSFEFRGMQPGRYQLTIEASRSYAAKSISADVVRGRTTDFGVIELQAASGRESPIDKLKVVAAALRGAGALSGVGLTGVFDSLGLVNAMPVVALAVEAPSGVAAELEYEAPGRYIEEIPVANGREAEAVGRVSSAAARRISLNAISGSQTSRDKISQASDLSVGVDNVGAAWNLLSKGSGSEKIGFEEARDLFLATQVNSGGSVADNTFLEQAYFPLQLLQALLALEATLPASVSAFALRSFETAQQAVRIASAELEQAVRRNATEGLTDLDAILLAQLALMDTGKCDGAFELIVAALAERRVEGQQQNLLGEFARRHPGLEYSSGVCRGGTFVLVYDDDSTIVADFCLPYQVDDCWQEQCRIESVRFSLPQSSFCKTDTREYRFGVHPPGGDVYGPGVRRDALTGDFLFSPSRAALAGAQAVFHYRLDGLEYELQVRLEQLDARLLFEIELVDMNTQQAHVQFRAEPAGDDATYEWSFGAGVDGSTEQAPRRTFDITEDNELEVSLSVTRRVCQSQVTERLVFEAASALWTVEEVEAKREADARTYRFLALQVADTYSWDFGDDGSFDSQSPQIRFELHDSARLVSGELSVTVGAASARAPVELELPSAVPLLLELPREQFCTTETEPVEFIAEPPGGVLVGPGVEESEGRWSWLPSATELIPGPQRFLYTLGDRTVARVVQLSVLSAVLDYEMLLVDWERRIAQVRFSSVGSQGDQIAWELGDGATDSREEFVHEFALGEGMPVGVLLRVSTGECEVSAEAVLSFEPVSADFSFALDTQARSLRVQFNAKEPEAEHYFWDFGDGSPILDAQTSQWIYDLNEEEGSVLVRLEVRKGVGRALREVRLTLPAADPVELELQQSICAQGADVPVIAHPKGGEFSPPIVEDRDGRYWLRPALAGVARGTLELAYRVGTQVASAELRFLTPKAEGRAGAMTRESDGRLLVRFVNTSIDANRFEWRFGDGQEEQTRAPIVRFGKLSDGEVMKFSLRASWNGECSHGITGILRAPKSSAGERLRGLVATRVGLIDSLERRPDLLESDDEITRDVRDLLTKLQSELSDRARLKALMAGEGNIEWGERFIELQQAIAAKAQRFRSAPAIRREFAYEHFLQLVEVQLLILGEQRHVLEKQDALLKSLVDLPAQLKAFASDGIKLDAEGRLSALVAQTLGLRQEDELLVAALRDIQAVL